MSNKHEKEVIARALKANAKVPESEEGNIEYICSDCVKKKYRRKGTFTEEDMQYWTHVKKAFGPANSIEHMWVKILKVTKEGIEGEVANDPCMLTSPCFGQKTFVKYEEIEDVC